jgi:hypothetical protein
MSVSFTGLGCSHRRRAEHCEKTVQSGNTDPLGKRCFGAIEIVSIITGTSITHVQVEVRKQEREWRVIGATIARLYRTESRLRFPVTDSRFWSVGENRTHAVSRERDERGSRAAVDRGGKRA